MNRPPNDPTSELDRRGLTSKACGAPEANAAGAGVRPADEGLKSRPGRWCGCHTQPQVNRHSKSRLWT